MAVTATERLLRVLELEEKQGWRNRAVVGGLEAMAERWRDDAAAELDATHDVEQVTRLMREYDRAEIDARPEIAHAIERFLEGDAEAASAILGDAAS